MTDMTTVGGSPFMDWVDDLRCTAIREFGFTFRAAATLHPDGWRPFYEDGCSPTDNAKWPKPPTMRQK